MLLTRKGLMPMEAYPILMRSPNSSIRQSTPFPTLLRGVADEVEFHHEEVVEEGEPITIISSLCRMPIMGYTFQRSSVSIQSISMEFYQNKIQINDINPELHGPCKILLIDLFIYLLGENTISMLEL
jgi:hypothetical protein